MGEARFLTLAVLAAIGSGHMSGALPMQFVVNQRASECLYERLDEKESATISAFLLSGPELKATVTVDGPIAPLEIDSGKGLAMAVEAFESTAGSRTGGPSQIRIADVVDFEHLSLGEYDEGHDDDVHDDDDDYADDDSDDEADHKLEAQKQRRARQRRKALEARQKKEAHHHKQKKKVREEGEAYQKTFQAPTKGWYQFCIKATWYQVTAEIDFRKESELGGMNEYGHVMTFEQKALAEEDKLMEEDSAVEEGIKDEDFVNTKEKLKTLRRLLADIEVKQKQERHRLIVHAATNEHSHSRMVLGSLLETIFFMAVTGVQIMTIRRWFKGAPVLGR